MLIVLAFMSVLTLLFATWLTLTVRQRAARSEAWPEPDPVRPRPTAAARRELSNDAVRGARAPRKHPPADSGVVAPSAEGSVRVRPRARDGEDPFERFLEPGRRRDEF